MWKRVLDIVTRIFRKPPDIIVSRGQVVTLESGVFDHVVVSGGVLRFGGNKMEVGRLDVLEGRVDFQ
jgi:hypothetical protein